MSLKLLNTQIKHKLRSELSISSCDVAVAELVLNSLDANASSVAVRVNLRSYRLQVVDNGDGICENDMSSIGKRFMTSKCRSISDINNNLDKFGFRGEALASLIELSQELTIESLYKNSDVTHVKEFYKTAVKSNGIIEKTRPCHGTTVTVNNFMYNMKVRQKRIHHIHEMEMIKSAIESIALINHNVSFTLRDDYDGSVLLGICKTKSVEQAFAYIYGVTEANDFKMISNSHDTYAVKAYIANNGHTTNTYQFIYVNKRHIIHTGIYKLFVKALKRMFIMNNDKEFNKHISKIHPIFIVNITCSFNAYDVTLEPNKSKVWFKNWDIIVKLIDGFFDKLFKNTKEHAECKINADQKNIDIKEMINAALKKNAHDYHATQMNNVVKGKPAKRMLKKQSKPKKVIMSKDKKRKIQSIQLSDPTQTDHNENDKKVSLKKFESNVNHLSSKYNRLNKKMSLNVYKSSIDHGSIINKNLTNLIGSNYIKDWLNNNVLKYNHNHLHSKLQEKRADLNENSYMRNELNRKVFLNNYRIENNYTYLDNQSKSCAENNINKMDGFYRYINNALKDLKSSSKLQASNYYNFHNENMDIMKNSYKKNTNFYFTNLKLNKSNKNVIQKPISTYSLIKTVSNMNMNTTKIRSFKIIEQSQSICINKKSKQNIPFNLEKNDKFSHYYNVIKDVMEMNQSSWSLNTSINIFQDQCSLNKTSVITEDNNFIKSKLNLIENLNVSSNLSQSILNEERERRSNNIITSMNINKDILSKQNEVHNSLNDNDENRSNLNILNSNEIEKISEDIVPQNINMSTDIFSDQSSVQCITNNEVILEMDKSVEMCEDAEVNKNLSINIFSDQSSVQCITNNEIILETDKSVEMCEDNEVNNNLSIIVMDINNDEIKDSHNEAILENNVKQNSYIVSKRPSFMPKGMSPILKITEMNVKTVNKNQTENYECFNQNFDHINWNKNYYKKELYETFMRNVAENSTSFVVDDFGKMLKMQNFGLPLVYKKEMLSTVTVINQVDNKFIASVIENQEQKYLVMFDQHAVDERINLERLLKEHYDGTSWKSVAYSKKYFKNQLNVDLLVEYRKSFETLGITFDLINESDEVLIKTIPACINLGSKTKSIIDQCIDMVFDEEINVLTNTRGNINKLPNTMLDILASEACHTAIKFGKPLSKNKCEKLITALSKCETPFQCAHGRPLIATLLELNKIPKEMSYRVNLKKIQTRI